MTEFCGEPDERGLYRRYAALRVDDRIIPADIYFGRHWEVRGLDKTLVVNEQILAEEVRFLQNNSHETQLRDIFGLACIDYRRVDYGVVGGRVQVYEIDTNPYIAPSPLGGEVRAALYEHFARDFLAALTALQLQGPGSGSSLTIATGS